MSNENAGLTVPTEGITVMRMQSRLLLVALLLPVSLFLGATADAVAQESHAGHMDAGAAAPHRITWQWVRGHDGHVENERVDRLACDAAEMAKG